MPYEVRRREIPLVQAAVPERRNLRQHIQIDEVRHIHPPTWTERNRIADHEVRGRYE